MNALETKNLTKIYPAFTLDHVSLALPGGCVLGLIGENGAGKSTLIKLILGIIHRNEGSVTILGHSCPEALALAKEDVGVVLDEVGLPLCLNAQQVGKIMAATYKTWDGELYRQLLRRLSVPENTSFKDMSKGMKMKLGIAAALGHKPRLLILCPGRRPLHSDLLPHRQRFGEAVRLHCLPPQGPSASDGGKGPAAGGIRPAAGQPRPGGRPAKGRGEGPEEPPLRRGSAGTPGAGARREPGQSHFFGGAVCIYGQGG